MDRGRPHYEIDTGIVHLQSVEIISGRLPTLAVEKFLRRYKNQQRRDKIAPLYQAMLADAKRVAAPASIYGEFSLNETPALSTLLPTETTTVVLALCTLGLTLEQHAKALADSNLASAVVFDEISTSLISAVARDIHRHVKDAAHARGLKAGPPFRPGLGRMPIEAQQVIFDRLPADKIEVSLQPSLLMMPTKTISLVIPLLARAQK